MSYKERFGKIIFIFQIIFLIAVLYILSFEGIGFYMVNEIGMDATFIIVDGELDRKYDIKEQIDQIPPEFKEGVTQIYITNNLIPLTSSVYKIKSNIELYDEGLEVIGFYKPTIGAVYILDNFNHTIPNLLHELGHHYYRKMSIKEKEEYRLIYYRTDNEYIKKWLHESVTEDFAESFSMYMYASIKNESLAIEDERYKFFEKMIGFHPERGIIEKE